MIKEGPNTEEIEVWNGAVGEFWTESGPIIDKMYQPFGDQVVATAKLKSGARVIDIGCGCGATTHKVAEQIGREGSITALDVSVSMIDMAKTRLRNSIAPIEIIEADAETYSFETSAYDTVISKFGVMFFAHPIAAFSNFCSALKPGGNLVFVCWQLPDVNPWMLKPFEAINHFAPQVSGPDPDAQTSPFSFARPEKIERILKDSGFSKIKTDQFSPTVSVGDGKLDQCIDFISVFNGPVSAVIREAGEDKIDEIRAAMTNVLAPHHKGQSIEFASNAWIVSAQRPLN